LNFTLQQYLVFIIEESKESLNVLNGSEPILESILVFLKDEFEKAVNINIP